MGNYFSGNRRDDRKPVVEDFLCLDVNRLSREGLLRLPAEPCIWRWWERRGGEPVASVSLRAGHVIARDGTELDDANYLRIAFWRGDTAVRRVIQVVWQACHFGGSRPYFLCPSCRKKRTNLFLMNGDFICRECGNMGYACQLEHRPDRLLRRAIKLRRRLGAGPGVRDFIDRPRGMHRTRFHHMLDEIEGLEAAALAWAVANL